MCGVNGIYNFREQLVRREELEEMNNKMIHRGPDDDGFFISGSFGMSMRRLSIIDLETGKQPLANENERYQVIFNGEIYNYLELKEDLEKKGHVFKTKSDTEVLVHLFEEKGPQGVHDLNGMFVFAIWDDLKRELFIFRDRAGVKPLFYYRGENRFIFSSDLSSLNTVLKNKTIDLEAFLLYLGLSYVPCPKTIFKGIFKLPAGHFIQVKGNGEIKINKYWDISEFETLTFGNLEDYKEIILGLLRDSIRLRLRSDVPIGTFLSGGLDSSAVVALLSGFIDEPVRTFSIGFEGGLNELPDARIIAQRFKTNHQETILKGDEIAAIINESILFMDEPLSDNAFIPTLVLSKFAREKGVKVILNGTGGDELFGGYHRYLSKRLSWRLLEKSPLAWRKIFGRLFSYFNVDKGLRVSSPALNFITAISGINFSFALSLLRDPLHRKQLTNSLLGLYNQYVGLNFVQSKLHRLMYFDFKSYLADDILSLLDKMTMATSIEGRVPLLDYRLVEVAFKIPNEIKFYRGQLKGLFRETLRDILPKEILNLPKKGLAGSTVFWANKLKPSLRQHLIQETIPFYKEIFNINILEENLVKKEIDSSSAETLFSLYIFSLWYKKL